VFGPIFSDKRYFIHDSNLANVKRGLIERVFFVRGPDGVLKAPPLPDEKFKSRLDAVRTYLNSFPKLKPLPYALHWAYGMALNLKFMREHMPHCW